MAKKNVKKFRPISLNELSNHAQTLLANIRFASVDEPVKTIVMTSTDIDEGKSTTAVALAIAMAKSGKRTLVMDCDMRRRSLGKILDVHPQHGIYAVLSGQATLKQAVTSTGTRNLYLLDCEPNIVNPSDLLSTKRFAALMETLRGVFDYVVIDTPPMGLFVDAAVVSALADGTALVVRQRQAKKKAVADALAQLRTANARVLGLVMTFAQKGDSDYYYYYAYYNEENKRVDKKAAEAGDAPASRREFDEEDVSAWAKRVGVKSQSVQEPVERVERVERRRHVERSASRHASHAVESPRVASQFEEVVPEGDDPYAPGAFKNAPLS